MPATPVTSIPHRPRLDPDRLALLGQRLAQTALREDDFGDGWDMGVSHPWLQGLITDWSAFDTAAFASRLDALDHLRAEVDGRHVHVLRAVGRGPSPLPLLLTHGWPGSFLEYLELLPLLCDPGSHGGDPADSFTVIVPSLPGFGWSDPVPPGESSAEETARRWQRIMTEGLGFDRYVAHGSDLGVGVTARLARGYPDSVVAIHLATPGLPAPPAATSGPETAYRRHLTEWGSAEGGYAHEHATKPSTIGVALLDSPVGLAAWVGEKIVSWSATTADDEPAFPRDLLLGTLTLYWSTQTIATSLWPYWSFRHDPQAPLPIDDASSVPTAVSNFGGEAVPFPKMPRSLAERYFTISHWADHDRGGHFPAVAEAPLLAETLRDVFRPYRIRT